MGIVWFLGGALATKFGSHRLVDIPGKKLTFCYYHDDLQRGTIIQ